MQRALMWLNLHGCEAVQHKLKNSLKTKLLTLKCVSLYSNYEGYTRVTKGTQRKGTREMKSKGRVLFRLPRVLKDRVPLGCSFQGY